MSSPPSAHCPSLPPEIWIRILSHHHELNHLWTTCRRVSPTFQAYVEQVFAEYHLRNTYIDFHLEKYNLGGKGRRPEAEIPTSFDRFSRDKKTVYFRDRRGGAVYKNANFAKAARERWEAQVRESKAECPHYTIQVGRFVNDTALPDLELDVEKREIGFEWRGMLRIFFREEERLRVLSERWHRAWKPQLLVSQAKVAAGEISEADHLAWSAKIWTACEKGFRKSIRRKRLKEHYRDNEEMLWAIDAMDTFESSKVKDIPGGRMGEPYYKSLYLPQFLLIDEWSSIHRIESKAEVAVMLEAGETA